MAGFFDTMFGGGAEREAADKNRALAGQYGLDANSFLKTGYDTGTANLNSAIGAYQPLSELGAKYNKGGDLFLDALGVNGAEGNTRATGAFQNNPGNEAAIKAALDGINRRRALGGMGDSGNADIDALNYAQNNQNQQYNTWLQNLSGAGQTGVGIAGNVAQGQAGGYTNLANLAGKYAGDQVGVSGNVLQGNTSANTLQAQGEASGAKNLLGAGLSLASLALGPIGGVAGGAAGGFGSSVLGAGLSGLKNMNIGQSLFAGGSPTGYG
jgi:hypothetical protein